MPSSKLKSPDGYPRHWIDALQFLAASPQPHKMTLESGLEEASLRTQHTKARAMKAAMLTIPGWGQMFKDLHPRLRFKAAPTYADPGRFNLIVYTIPAGMTEEALAKRLEAFLKVPRKRG